MNCYDKVEEKIGTFFERLGHVIAKHPWKIIIVVIAVNGLLGIGMLELATDIDVSRVYTPMNSQAIKDESVVLELFPDKSGSDFYHHQAVKEAKSATVIIQPNDKNILDTAFLDECTRLDDVIRNVTALKDGGQVSYFDICARRSNSCVVNGNLFLSSEFRQAVINKNVTYPTFKLASGEDVRYSSRVMNAVVENGTLRSATHLTMQYFLRSDTTDLLLSTKAWAEQFIETLKMFSSEKFDFSFSHTDSLGEELNANVGGDIALFSVTFTLMIIYACFATYSAKHDCIGNRMLLGFGGVLAAGLSIIAAFGLVSACGMSFVSIVGNVPFLLIGIGVNDMFILLSGIADAFYDGDTGARVGQMMRRSGVAITITSLTDILAFGAGASSTFKSVRNFCVYTGVAILFCYLNQTLLFSSCVAVNENRVLSKRHFACCNRTKSKQELISEGASASNIFCCAGSRPTSRTDVEGLPERGIRKYFTKFVLLKPIKVLVIVLFSGYLGFSIWGATNLKQGLVTKDLVAQDSYFYKFQNWEDEFNPSSAPVSFIIDKTYQYSNTEVQENINDLLAAAQADEFMSNSSLSWLHAYKLAHSYRNSSEFDFVKGLRSFLQQPQYKQFSNDVVLSEDSITASRIYVFTTFIADSQNKGDMMQNMRKVASNSPLSAIAFSASFVYYEQYVAILPQTLQTLGVGLAAVFVVTAVFMPHPILLLFVVVTMGMIMTGVIGFMYFWNITLSSVTMIHLIMCVGFSVDFTAHICHAFMVADGDDRNERVAEAIVSSGGPIFNGAVSSILGILMLSIAKSYIFRSFFQVMLLVIVFGSSHSLLFLPVVLSLIGPRKGTKRAISNRPDAKHENGLGNYDMELTNGTAKASPNSRSSRDSGLPSPAGSNTEEAFKIPRPKVV